MERTRPRGEWHDRTGRGAGRQGGEQSESVERVPQRHWHVRLCRIVGIIVACKHDGRVAERQSLPRAGARHRHRLLRAEADSRGLLAAGE